MGSRHVPKMMMGVGGVPEVHQSISWTEGGLGGVLDTKLFDELAGSCAVKEKG